MIIDFDDSNMAKHIETFANNWKGPDFKALQEKRMDEIDLCQKKTINKFLKDNTDNYISRHDISLFKQWSVRLIHNILSKIKDNNIKYAFMIHLLSPHPNNGFKRFVIDKTFRKISTDVDGLKWSNYFPCDDFNFKQRNSLPKFVNLLQKMSTNQKKNRKRKWTTMENTIVDEKSYECKMQKIREIFSTLNKIQQQQLLMELNQMPPKKKLKK